MQYIAVLGRQPKISLAELEAVFSEQNITSIISELALVNAATINISRLGGTQKVARIIDSTALDYLANLPDGKLTLGISDYRRGATAKTAQETASKLAHELQKLRSSSIRTIPNQDGPALSTATTLHNSIGGRNPRKVELLLTERYTAIVTDVQSINAYTKRDQQRPARDARVGMLPPKLAQILVNLAAGQLPADPAARILDPFCGTGVVLQEALLMGYSAYGTDLEPRMIDYTKRNLTWLGKDDFTLEQGDATTHKWQPPIAAIASEIYLGQPFSAPPSEVKLREVQHVTGAILRSFLRNIHTQIPSGTPFALAIPAWRRPDGHYVHLKILDELDALGYNIQRFKHLEQSDCCIIAPTKLSLEKY